MRLSNILKSSVDSVKDKSLDGGDSSKKALNPSLTSPPTTSSHPSEEDIQKKIARQVEERLKAQSDEITRKLEDLKKVEQELKSERESLKKERETFAQKEKELTESIEAERAKLESERTEVSQAAESKDQEQAKAAQSQIHELQSRLKAQQESAEEKEKQLLVQAKLREDGLKKVAETLKLEVEALKKQAEKKDEQLKMGSMPVESANKKEDVPSSTPVDDLKPTLEAEQVNLTSRAVGTPQVSDNSIVPSQAMDAEQAKEIYDGLVHTTRKIFQDVAEAKPLDVESAKHYVQVMVEKDLCADPHFMAFVHGPYPEGGYFANHGVNCSVLAVAISAHFALSFEEQENLAMAALLHDIGLVNVHEDLDYPKEISGKLKKEILQHPEKGATLLSGILTEAAVEGIRQHHELYDGRGYPAGLKESHIGLFGKIIGLVDSFEAMTHQRPYRNKPLTVSEAIKLIITEGRSTHDKDVLKAMMNFIGVYPIYSMVELSNKKVAKVLAQNRKFPLSPLVQVEFDEWGKKLKTPEILDLSESRLIHIAGPVREPHSTFGEKQKSSSGHYRKKKKQIVKLMQQVLPFLIGLVVFLVFIYFILKV